MKSSGATSGELVPRHGRRDRRAGLGPHAVGGGDRAVAGVLVVVDEDPLAALLLPPFRRHLAGQAPLELAAEGDGGVAHVGERPARLDPDVDVDPAAAGGLGKPDVAQVAEQHARLGGDALGVGEVRAGLRVEVEAQLVGMVDVIAADRPRVEGDRAHLRGPGDDGDLGGADLVGDAARGERDPRGLHVLGRPARDPLLKEGVAAALLARRQDDARVHALRPALERRRPPRERAHDPVVDREVVPDDVELGDRRRALGAREDHAVGTRDAHIAVTGFDDRRLGLGHARSSTCRRPSSWAIACLIGPNGRSASGQAPVTLGRDEVGDVSERGEAHGGHGDNGGGPARGARAGGSAHRLSA